METKAEPEGVAAAEAKFKADTTATGVAAAVAKLKADTKAKVKAEAKQLMMEYLEGSTIHGLRNQMDYTQIMFFYVWFY